MAVNNTIFQGRMVSDAELKETAGGFKYLNFKLAWSERYKETETTCFLPCKAWRNTAEFIDKHMHNKGTEMVVEGRLETEEWEKDGQKQSRIILAVNKVHFCGKKQDAQSAAPVTAGVEKTAHVDGNDEPLPF